MFWTASWIWALTVKELGAKTVVKASRDAGLTDLLVLVKSVTGKVDASALQQLIEEAKDSPRIHAWVVCFADHSHEDAAPHNEAYRKYLLGIIKDLLEEYEVSGLHLDYIRYKSNASDKWRYVSSFVREVRRLVDDMKPGTTLSIASKVEDYESREGLRERALYYGQNYEDLAQYVDVFIPMTYYLDYNVEPLKAVIAAQWVKELTSRPVIMGIQLHPGEHPQTRDRTPRIEEIELQVLEAKRRGLDGICFFRFKHLYERLSEIRKVLSRIRD